MCLHACVKLSDDFRAWRKELLQRHSRESCRRGGLGVDGRNILADLLMLRHTFLPQVTIGGKDGILISNMETGSKTVCHPFVCMLCCIVGF